MQNIAVVGIANLFPGSADKDAFWQNLIAKKDLRSNATAHQMGYDPEAFYGAKGDADKYYCLSGGYIHSFTLDCEGFRLPADYISGLDDIYQWSLYVAREALKDAGLLNAQLEACGVILGNLSFPTKSSNHLFMPLYHKTVEKALQKTLANPQFRLEHFTEAKTVHPANALIAGYPSALVAQALGLGGANFSLDAACASSCYSVKLACDYLNTGKANVMLAGGVSAADPFFVNMGFSIFQAHPGNQISAPLDKISQGLYAGEGAGMLVLKRYEDARRDGDHIYAVIKGGGLSNDGKGEFVLSPNPKGQVLVYERAYADAIVDPKQVDFVECHATGTPRGDKVELGSMETFFGRHQAKPFIGSVKSNLAHLLTAAGMPAMTKTILAMNEGRIPPTINLTDPISSKGGYMGPAQIPTQMVAWPNRGDNGPRRAGVSTFGFGGCNAHLVFEEARGSVMAGVSPMHKAEPMAIVAMEAHFGAAENLRQVQEAVNTQQRQFTPLPPLRWKGIDRETELLKQLGVASGHAPQGAYVEKFDIDLVRFKIPPREDNTLIPQQLLLMKVADKAVQKAQLKESANVAVLVAMGTELELHQFRGRVNLDTLMVDALNHQGIQLSDEEVKTLTTIAKNSVHNAAQLNQYTSFIGNIMASRVSALWDFSGPALTVSAEENSVYRSLEIAGTLFQTTDVEAVVVAAVDLAGSAESVVIRNQIARFSEHGQGGWTVGEGAGAIVLKRLSEAKQQQDKIHGVIEAVEFANVCDAEAVKRVAERALKKSNRHAVDVRYVERYNSGVAVEDQMEHAALNSFYPAAEQGSIKNVFGHSFAASGIASLIHACFVVEKGKDLVAISGLSTEGGCAHVLLSAAPGYAAGKAGLPVSEKKKLQFIKTITLGGQAIQDAIESHAEELARVRARIQGAALGAVKQPIVVAPNATAYAIPRPAIEHATQLMELKPMGEKTIKTNPVAVVPLSQFGRFKDNMSQVSKTHAAFLDARAKVLNQTAELVKLQMKMAGGGGGRTTVPVPATPHTLQLIEKYSKPEKIVWDSAALIEFAEGDIAKVFGEEYAIIDTYPRRVRLPTTDYLLVNRVTALDAKTNEYKPSMMTTEYDIPIDAPYLIDGQIPWCVSVESGQCDLLLISYLGIDFQNKGIRVYRLLDCTLTFLEDMAFGGETLRYEIHIDSFARQGKTLLFFFHYDCFVGDKKVLIMRGGCAGFFTDQELAEGKGVVLTEDDRRERENAVKSSFTPFIENNTTSYGHDQVMKLIHGDIAGCFGPAYDQGGLNPTLKFSSEKFLMIDEVTRIDRTGGPWGLGLVEGRKRLEPDHWYFPCHFKDDQVLAGSLQAEGGGQLVMFFMFYLGMHTQVRNARFQPMPGEPQKVRCRGQVTPQSNWLEYRMEVTEIGLKPYPYMKANIDIILNGKVAVDFKNLGVLMKEQRPNTPYALPIPQTAQLKAIPRPAAPVASAVPVKKDPFANPRAPLMKVEPDFDAPKIKGVTPIKHFEAPMVEGQNRVPGVVPFEPWHMFEFATGDVSKCFGPEFDIYRDMIPPRTPCGDLQLCTRVTEVRGTRGDLKNPAYCRAEYEVPADAWYFEKNAHPAVMPYSILMEISLQPNGFISDYVGTTLRFTDKALFFRNLDGTGKLLRQVDLRGKTIVNDSHLLSTSMAGGSIIQSFTFTLSTDGEPFYDGKAVFGYFPGEALANQAGLDGGRVTRGWHLETNRPAQRIEFYPQHPMFQAPASKPYYRLAAGRLHFVDFVDVVEGGGKAGKGYVYAEKKVDPQDWFFPFHFHQDPVMPGSLGVEAIIEIMQVWALKNDLGAELKNPRFSQILSTIVWKYRGQIIPTNKVMSLDVHITDVRKAPGRAIVIGNANLWKDGLRIYEVKDIAICLEEV
jgi:acyl transferase domain-containing protein/3-hydroxymyristoyl/3-hydroxydecanoyl-(acyl carrier protein) dehydratase